MTADEKPTAEPPVDAPEAEDGQTRPEPSEAAREPSADDRHESEQAAEAAADAEIGELKSKLLHALADMENLRRRTEREITDARRYAVSSFAREMLTVGDNLRRALDAVPQDLRDGDDKGVAALIEGVEVTERSLEQTLEKFGVARIEAEGQKFDPAMHQAMMEVDDPDAEPGSVAAVIQTGYAIGDRVLRPAFVSVVKKQRAPKPDAAATADKTDPPEQPAD